MSAVVDNRFSASCPDCNWFGPIYYGNEKLAMDDALDHDAVDLNAEYLIRIRKD